MRRAILLIVLSGCAGAALSGCASTGSAEDEGSAKRAKVLVASDMPTIYAERPQAVEVTFRQPTATVWNAVKKVYGEYEVPLSIEDPAKHQLGNGDFFKSYRMAGRPMTEIVDCGSSATGSRATNFRIYMSMVTTVLDDGGGKTTIQTTFAAAGRDMGAGGTNTRLPCSSTGKLETMFHSRIDAILRGLAAAPVSEAKSSSSIK